MFPLSIVFDSTKTNKWMMCYVRLEEDEVVERLDRWNRFQEEVLSNFTKYKVPVIVLKKETTKEAVCTVFEKVNTGGVELNVFELLTATFAAQDFRLKEDWNERQEATQKA